MPTYYRFGLDDYQRSRQRDHVVRRTVQKIRSRSRKVGRGRFLSSKASWQWRSAMTSTAMSSTYLEEEPCCIRLFRPL